MNIVFRWIVGVVILFNISANTNHTSFQHKPKIIGKKLPYFKGVAISGQKIDSTYFKNKVTLITFFYIGCPPCLSEINGLKKLKKQKNFQVLYIVSQTGWEMKQFNSDWPNQYSKIRMKYKVGKIEYDILPQCEETKQKPLIEPDCNAIAQKFRATVFPSTYLIDKMGIIREVWYGFGMDSTDHSNIKSWQKEIDQLLSVKNK